MPSTIFQKTHKVLQLLLIVFLLILCKIWYLTAVKKDEKLLEARRPQLRTILQTPNRGTIVDRFNLPLAMNRIRYNAAIYYAEIKQIPAMEWQKNPDGNKEKVFPRKDYIKKLSSLLGKELSLDPERIEDLIHAKASLLPHTPYLIKENISEETYYRLRMLERDFAGLHAEISSERYYPCNQAASTVLGYMSTISQDEYFAVAQELQLLQDFLEKEENEEHPIFPEGYQSLEDLVTRYYELKEKAYTVNDLIGKTGLEGKFEEQLRGFRGKKTFEIDIKGNFLKETSPTAPPISGKKLISTLSVELQEFCEQLLAQEEKLRDGKSRLFDSSKSETIQQKQPWIKGGAIVAMDPNTGEILALASYPGFDPNDFIPAFSPEIKKEKQKHINQWLETQKHISDIFDGKEKLKRTIFLPSKKHYGIEEKSLTLPLFLSLILPQNSSLYSSLEKISSIKEAIALQENFQELLYLSKQNNPSLLMDVLFPEKQGSICTKTHWPSSLISQTEESLKEKDQNKQVAILKKKTASVLSNISHNADKLFLIDLCRLLVLSPAFSDELIEKKGQIPLSSYWNLAKSLLALEEKILPLSKEIFSKLYFTPWKEQNQKSFLAQKREEEKRKHLYPKPYIDYLDQMQSSLFSEFWKKYRLDFLVSLCKEETFQETLFTPYLKKWKKECENFSFLQSLFSEISCLNFEETKAFFKTMRSFQDLDRPLLAKYPRLSETSPTEKTLAACFYPLYGFGFSRSNAFADAAALGSIFKIVTSYAALYQRYLSLQIQNPSKFDLNPLTMIDECKWDNSATKGGSLVVGYSLDGRPYTKHYKKGRLPSSSHSNIGKIDFLSALEQSSNPYFSILAGDFLSSPDALSDAAKLFGFGKRISLTIQGEVSGFVPSDLCYNPTGLYSFAIGQHSFTASPLQTAVMLCCLANGGKLLKPQISLPSSKAASSSVSVNADSIKPEVVKTLSLPPQVRKMILDGMHKVLTGQKGSARSSIIKKLASDPSLVDLHHEFSSHAAAKTSTAEFNYAPDFLPSGSLQRYKNIWFGTISFDPNTEKKWEKPELVVVVFLKFGDAGKEAAPLAMQVAKKYQEILERHVQK
jgi:cell division protein FtsI/penicillin-binding protein 2